MYVPLSPRVRLLMINVTDACSMLSIWVYFSVVKSRGVVLLSAPTLCHMMNSTGTSDVMIAVRNAFEPTVPKPGVVERETDNEAV